jgi:hypothetical protein
MICRCGGLLCVATGCWLGRSPQARLCLHLWLVLVASWRGSEDQSASGDVLGLRSILALASPRMWEAMMRGDGIHLQKSRVAFESS